jgi:hypothetical protein
MERKPSLLLDYHSMAVLAVVVGVLTIALQLVPGFELISFMLSVAALGGLLSGTSRSDDQARERLSNSYKVGFESLLLIIMAAYALMEVSSWQGLQGVSAALSSRWPGLLLAIMCLVMGLAALRAGRTLQRSA